MVIKSKTEEETCQDLVDDYNRLGEIRPDEEKARAENKTVEEQQPTKEQRPQKSNNKTRKAPSYKGRRPHGELHSCVIKIPEEISQDIDRFCKRFNQSRMSWFLWAISTQFLTDKKRMKDAGEWEEGAESNDKP